MASIPIKLADEAEIDGSGPVVLIGPNGVGKSRLGSTLASRRGYERIPALRSLNFDESLPLWRMQEAKQNVESQINQTKNKPWQTAQELSSILGEIKAEDAQAAVDFRDEWVRHPTSATPKETNLNKLRRLWKLTFPGRDLDLSTYQPLVTTSLPGRSPNGYAANQMSDGERAALYLISRVLRAQTGIVVIDEPEVHFHALLARTFWDIIESERSDCRFVYITHDIPFALSRRGARIGIVRSQTEIELVGEDAPIPPDLYESILGAASLSMVARRVVFCEGKNGRSLDPHIYGAWFQNPDTVVVPVGSCTDVERAVHVFAENPIIANASALGIVDRDYWSDARITSMMAEGLHVLPTNEIEGLLCLGPVATAVMTHLGKSAGEIAQLYNAFEANVRAGLNPAFVNRQILERAKREMELRLLGLTNGANPNQDRAITRSNLVAQADVTNVVPDVGALFDTNATKVDQVVAQSAQEFLAVLPGKFCFGILCATLGVTQDNYSGLVTKALSQPDTLGDASFEVLRAALIAALAAHLPPRRPAQ